MNFLDPPYSIYLHIPFCSIRCTYCAFNTYTHLNHLIEPFVDALIREIEILAAGKPQHPVGTIYLGGGTPSLLTPHQIRRLLGAVRRCFDVLPDAEISIEANPADINSDYLAAVRASGLNRLSIGMQSANANELALFARRHSNDDVERAVGAARRAGFGNLNLDLIYGVPHQTLDSWDASLRQMLALKPEHVSLYALGLEDGTAMKAWVATGRLPHPDDDLAADMYELATALLANAGYEQYEISNWSKPGFACHHNIQYWRNLSYPGLGPGAHGYVDRIRYSTILSPQRYIKTIHESSNLLEFPRTPAVSEAVLVDWETEIAETLLMGLRLTQEGIQRLTFCDRFGVDLVEYHRPVIERFVDQGLLTVSAEAVRITEKGRLLSNFIFRELV
jgi:putative oxygen-independent coproporphyrinogen III oxidase